ncbi:PREDICTED: uncharacterized protein LOC109333981 [Lupinus angustifolius]|uniref:uncharacterized protein LOC109333981 n=1 Tax=Lupinus angustifolius TaxID=3871 RepID=UPI00092FA0F0|nr:PREDICTED: uncharacterized protein LOC109333981 [Lupinus angustifolius]
MEITRTIDKSAILTPKPCFTTMEYAGKLIYSSSGKPLPDPSLYRRLMGKLLYLTHTRPGLSVSAGYLEQFLSNPTNMYLEGDKRILKYLKGSISVGIFFSIDCDFKVKGYTNSDSGGCPDTRRSVFGYYFYIGNSLVSRKSKKRRVMAKSSTKAEYRALALVGCEAL